MRGYRFKIALLSLGVVLGYGSAVSHFMYRHHRGYEHGCHALGWDGFGNAERDGDHAPPAKHVQ
jgi:hypothetical protein